MLGIELQNPQPDSRRIGHQLTDQRRQQLDDAGVDDAEIERAM